MNISEASKQMQPNIEYKFVATFVPPMMAIAHLDFGNHAKMGYKLKLVKGFGTPRSPFMPIDPTNFRAGRLLKNNDGDILLTNGSVDFPDSMPNDNEFEALLGGDIEILS